jgi:hypothetical protein
MATSGSVDYTRTRDNIINDAYRLCGAVALGETPSSEESAAGVAALQAMVKAWQADGTNLWKIEDCVLFLTKGTERYSLGASGDRAALSSDTVVTKVNGDHSSSDTTILVDSVTGMAASDAIGIVLDDGSIHWTTISSISSLTITIASGIASAAADNNIVFTYTTLLARPLRILDARRRVWTDPTAPVDVPFSDMLSREEYFDLPNKMSEGKPVQGFYDPQLSKGDFYLWNAPDSAAETVNFTGAMPIEDFDAAGNDPDFPQEWIEAVTWNLAVRLAPAVGTPIQERGWLKNEAAEKKYLLSIWDSEPASVFFQPRLESSE